MTDDTRTPTAAGARLDRRVGRLVDEARDKSMELEGKELDAAVALALGWDHPGAVGKNEPTMDGTPWCRSGCNDWWRHPVSGWLCGPCYGFPYQYSTDWAQGGPLIESERIDLIHVGGKTWGAKIQYRGTYMGPDPSPRASGSTPLTAAMRALVRSKTPNVRGDAGA